MNLDELCLSMIIDTLSPSDLQNDANPDANWIARVFDLYR